MHHGARAHTRVHTRSALLVARSSLGEVLLLSDRVSLALMTLSSWDAPPSHPDSHSLGFAGSSASLHLLFPAPLLMALLPCGDCQVNDNLTSDYQKQLRAAGDWKTQESTEELAPYSLTPRV